MPKDYLFVYGTLRKCFDHPMHQSMIRYAEYHSAGLMNGKLYDLGNYPGMVYSNADNCSVTGDIYIIKDREKLFWVLDSYEGISESGHVNDEYIRVKREADRADTDEALVCWVYLYNRNPQHFRRILSGDYCAYIQD